MHSRAPLLALRHLRDCIWHIAIWYMRKSPVPICVFITSKVELQMKNRKLHIFCPRPRKSSLPVLWDPEALCQPPSALRVRVGISRLPQVAPQLLWLLSHHCHLPLKGLCRCLSRPVKTPACSQGAHTAWWFPLKTQNSDYSSWWVGAQRCLCHSTVRQPFRGSLSAAEDREQGWPLSGHQCCAEAAVLQGLVSMRSRGQSRVQTPVLGKDCDWFTVFY